ncbi:meiotic recombination protein REC114 [Cyclopterus lumpus]|uniref:meiotic recombination protein REC114 n=1 Tax=Cyclopterus lumpus TaxID=8103 RepID=UPI0014873C1E|nr:meiotic recombination protein REC114 [Cyclopterus lumpus]
MATSQAWRLKRYGRCIGDSTRRTLWKVFDLNDNGPEMFLTIVKSGYLLVMRGQESLDTIPFLSGSDSVKVQQKSENLIFRCTVNGESRMMRMQFDGIEECASAVETLKEYVSVTTQDGTPSPPNQPPAEASAPVTQNCQGKAMEVDPEVVRGSLSIKHLTQHILGETVVTLPQVYRHASLAQGDLEPILRVCLLDPSFPAFVEKVEEELRKLLEE